MEADASPPRRPVEVSVLAVLAASAAIFYLTFALVGLATRPDRDWKLALSVTAIYGMSRLAAMHGLRRMKRYGAILEMLSAIVWIGTSIFLLSLIIKDGSPDLWVVLVWIVPLIASALFSAAEAIYLGRPSMMRRFADWGVPGTPLTRKSAAGPWLAVTAVTIVLTLVLAPNRIETLVRTRQKRTIDDMRSIAQAWEARATDLNRYNASAMSFPTSGVTIENLEAALSPTYIKVFPRKDAWGNAWGFGVDAPWAANDRAVVYVIISYGRDGRSEGKWKGGATTDFDCDIIYSNGVWLQWPEGLAMP